MRNRAKCKLCATIIESFHPTDWVSCKCSEIYVDGGSAMQCGSNDWNNFLRVDDEGNEIIVAVQEKKQIDTEVKTHKPTKKELLDMLDEMIKTYENLPPQAMSLPISHYDYCSVLMLLSSILRAD